VRLNQKPGTYMETMMNEVKFDSGALVCPKCDYNNLHQESITVNWRKEDADVGVNVFSSLRGTIENKDIRSNPSPRRDGILIRFKCEHCDAEPDLAIFQHKGLTLINWYSWRK